MTEYLSGEQHHKMRNQDQSQNNFVKPIMIVAAALIISVLSFYGGIKYQKAHQPKTAASAAAASQGSPFGQGGPGGGLGGGGFSGQRPTFGSVTAVNASSITVNDQTSGSSKTFSITSATTITDNIQTVTTSDISVGATVAVIADSSSSSQASRILVNPSFGGGNAPPTTSN